jgi:signal transduction histidine kinase
MSLSIRCKYLFLLVALTGALVLISGCISESESPSADLSGSAPVISSSVSPEKLVVFVQAAHEYAQVHGQEAALREFNNQNGQFIDGELYIFAYDSEGTTLALPFQPEVIGTDRWNITDANGTAYVRDIVTTAQSGGGFTRYLYADPADNFTVKQKLSYVMIVDENWVIGAGIYFPDIQQKMTTSDLAAHVQNASAYMDAVGEEAALEEFSRTEGLFSHGNIYIYAYDYKGTLLAHPYENDLVGKNRLNSTDVRGLPVTRIGAHTASNGGGFIAYLYPAPENGTIDEKAMDSYQPKIGYVSPAGEQFWIGSGLYFTDIVCESAGECPGTVSEMVRLVERCAAYGKEQGSALAFDEISNRSGMFVDAEGHYIYAYDYNGTLLAHPYLPEMIGSSLIEKRDPFRMENVRALADTARSGGGYVVFVWPNPDKGNREELKIGYVLPVNDAWWVGSGVYLSKITGEDSFFSSSSVPV